MEKLGADLRKLSTFQFGLILLTGLAVFTFVVAGLSIYRNLDEGAEDVETRTFEATPPPAGQAASEETVQASKSASAPPDFEHYVPRLDLPQMDKPVVFTSGTSDWVTYNKEGRPYIHPAVNEDHPQMKNWRQRLKDFLVNLVLPAPDPSHAANRLLKTAERYLYMLENVESLLKPAGASAQVTYYDAMDEVLIKTEANYLSALEDLRKSQKAMVGGVTECLLSLPTVAGLTRLPKLPIFDSRMREGENSASGTYVLAPGAPDPYRTLALVREHVNTATACARSVLDPAAPRVLPKQAAAAAAGAAAGAQETQSLPPGVMGALRPGEAPEAQKEEWPPAAAQPPEAARERAAEERVYPKFVDSEGKPLPHGVWGPLRPGEVPDGEKPKTSTPTPPADK